MKLVKFDRNFNMLRRYYCIVMKQGYLANEWGLRDILSRYVHATDKDRLAVLAGHFPLMYKAGEAYPGLTSWGEFPTYSLELGCFAAREAREIGKNVKFVLLADDAYYELYMNLNSSSTRTRRRAFYRSMSGENAILFPTYREILATYGFSEADVLRQDQGKIGREDCLIFSEKVLRAANDRVENECARAYVNLVEDPRYFDRERDSILAFVPNRCMGHICDVALDQEIKGLDGLHVFMETMAPFATREKLYSIGRGVTYRQD
jgi:hypothetical protein